MNYKIPFHPQRLLALFMSVMLVFPAPVFAGLSDELSDMADKMKDGYTGPNVNAQSRGYVTGPKLRVRYEPWQIEEIKLFHVEQPSWDVGCNGMDLHTGAFSWITSSQIEQMLQQFASPSLWIYSAYLALMQVCEPCKQVASELNQWANRLNQGLYFDCEKSADMIANGMVAAGEYMAGKEQVTEEAAKNYDSASGDAYDNRKDKYPSELTQTAESETDTKLTGNFVWDAMTEDRNLDAELNNAMVNINNVNEMKYLIMSLTGAYVKRFEGDGSLSTNTTGPKIPDFRKLIHGGNIQLLACASGMPANANSYPGTSPGGGYTQSIDHCRWLLHEDVVTADQGVSYASVAVPDLFSQAYEILDPSDPNSLFQLMRIHDSANQFSDEIHAFTENSGFPLIKLARDYAMGGQAPPAYQAEAIAKIVAIEQALSFMLNTLHVAHAITQDVDGFQKPIRQNLASARDYYVSEASRLVEQEMRLLEANKLISGTAMENIKRRMREM